jgi:O-antigen/teichoic acid export membrane protein
MLGMGVGFLILQLAVAASVQSDALIVGQLIGPEAVAKYSVPLRLFLIAPFLLGLALVPLWPAYGEALARGDVEWVKNTLRRSMRLTLVLTVPSALALVVAAPAIVGALTDHKVTTSQPLLVGFALWSVLFGVWTVISIFMNGIGAIKLQALLVGVTTLVMLPAIVGLTNLFGLPGVIFGIIGAHLALNVGPSLALLPRLLHSIRAPAHGAAPPQ